MIGYRNPLHVDQHWRVSFALELRKLVCLGELEYNESTNYSEQMAEAVFTACAKRYDNHTGFRFAASRRCFRCDESVSPTHTSIYVLPFNGIQNHRPYYPYWGDN